MAQFLYHPPHQRNVNEYEVPTEKKLVRSLDIVENPRTLCTGD
jgi:hypothetical protein